MKISVKLILVMIGLNVAGIGILGGLVLIRSRTEIRGLINENAVNIARESGSTVQVFLEAYMNMMRTASQFMSQYESINLSDRRTIFNTLLEGLARENPELIGTWTLWEPDALDGMDARYANTEGSDGSGRFVPYWVRNADGTITVEPLEEGDYYTIPKETGNEAILDPFIYNVNGKDILMTSLAVPIKKNGRVVAVVGVDISVEQIQTITSAIKPFGADLTAVFGNNGTVSAHFDQSRVGKNMADTEKDMAGPYLNDFIRAVKNGMPFSCETNNPEINSKVYVYAAPIQIGRSTTPWSMAVGVLEKDIMAPVYRMLYLSLLIAALTILVVTAVSFFLARSISNPILLTVGMLKDISEGEGDLTKTIPVHSKDEIGDMSHYFNLTLEKIKNLIITIKRQAVALFDIGNELSSNMTQTAAAINEITANIQSIKTRVINQSAAITETNATMEQITGNIDALNGNIEKQTESVSRSSSAIEQMLANIQSVTQTLVKNAANVQSLADASDAGHQGLRDVAADIEEIARESEGLLEINGVMQNIASQTNLLSMNAAIEAAHAGESGKGFAVVADEIRKLAENSQAQSKTISAVLKKIKGAIDKITVATNNVLNQFEAIGDGVKTVADQEENIRGAMEEQGEGSRQVLESVGQLNEVTRMVKGGSQEMLEGSRQIITEGKNLEAATAEISNGMDEMSTGADQITSAVSEVNTLSSRNRDNIDILVKEVSRFKIE
ncbi:methyl-accepting chemotaxis protein [Spirochaetia bacterium]|nr:methyl-accepting chemotaxis protein [Spirochaetia bacterium]